MKINIYCISKTGFQTKGKKFLVFLLYLTFIIEIIAGIIWIFSETGPKDFGSFYESGKAYLNGQNPFADSYEYIFKPLLGNREIPSPNLNPPFSVYLFSIFTFFNIRFGFRLWQVISVALYITGIYLFAKDNNNSKQPLHILFAFSIAGFWHTLELGQIYIFLFFLLILIYLSVKKQKDMLSGLLLGLLIAIKPNFMILPIFLFVSKYRKIACTALMTSAILSFIPIITDGTNIYFQWIQATIKYQGISYPGNSSLVGLFSSFNIPQVGYYLSILLFIGLIIFLYKKRADIRQVLGIGIAASLLLSPIAWSGYMVMFVPYIMEQKWGKLHSLCVFMLSFPVILTFAFLNASIISEYIWLWWYGYAFSILLGLVVWNIYSGEKEHSQL